MNRSPRPGVSSTSLRARYTGTPSPRPPVSPSSSRLTVPGTPSARQTSPSPRKRTPVKKQEEATPETPEKKLSLKEQIALKRAEAKKSQVSNVPVGDGFGVDDDPMAIKAKSVEEDADSMGRWSVRETIERARSSGNLNLSSRSLVCIPSCLYEIHLGITPKPLEAITEPDYSVEVNPRRARASKQQPSWYDAQDLTILKARTNEIKAIQPEIALFGSLKVVDLHSNRLETLPTSMAILAFLTNLDVSDNNLTVIPPALFSLPALTSLNVAKNQLTSLPFSKFDTPIELPESLDMGAFFQPEVSRSNVALPKLTLLDASDNKISSSSIDLMHLPAALARLMLNNNPLGPSSELLLALSGLESLQEIHMIRADIKDVSFTRTEGVGFPRLQILDLSDTEVTERAVTEYFAQSPRANNISFQVTTAPPSPGELRISVGKKVIKEKWEIEAEQHYLRKKKSAISIKKGSVPIQKEPWELEAEQGMTTEAGRRRVRLASMVKNEDITQQSKPAETTKAAPAKQKVVEKEPWEIEAELGLTTEAGRRKLRAQQARIEEQITEAPSVQGPKSPKSLADTPYYTKSSHTLSLPPSIPPTRSHARAFSLAAKPLPSSSSSDELSVPVSTLPMDVIVKEDFAVTLRVLTLSNRRADPTFHFPPTWPSASILPHLEELSLDGCALGDMVTVSQVTADGGSPQITKRGLLEVIADTFSNLTTLDLSYNAITSDGLVSAPLKRLLVPSEEEGKGLKVFRLRGNRLSNLEAFEPIANLFRGNQRVIEWRLEELDVRDNEISKLPVLMGLLPLDVFLVEGNTFRIPQRKVWEREGTRGLLSWLRGRVE